MKPQLTPKQKTLIKIAKSKGKLTFKDCNMVYSDHKTMKAALNRLILANIIKKGHADDFIYRGERDKTIMEYLK